MFSTLKPKPANKKFKEKINSGEKKKNLQLSNV